MIILLEIFDINPTEVLCIPLEVLDLGHAADIPDYYARTFNNGGSEIAVEVTRECIQIMIWARGYGIVRYITMDDEDTDYSEVALLQIEMPYSFYDKYINDDQFYTYDMAEQFFKDNGYN